MEFDNLTPTPPKKTKIHLKKENKNLIFIYEN